MTVGYTSGVFDLFHIGHLNVLRRAKLECDYLIAGVWFDDVAEEVRDRPVVVPFADRLEIVRSMRPVDAAFGEGTTSPVEMWRHLQFSVLFKGSDWKDTEKGRLLERRVTPLGVSVVYLPYTETTSSPRLRESLAIGESDR